MITAENLSSREHLEFPRYDGSYAIPKTMSKKTPPQDAAWNDLTLSDIEDWAGSEIVTHGKAYQKQGKVRELCMSNDGVLLAWVDGTHRYATRVELQQPKKKTPRLSSACSCPVALNCKHGVAVLMEMLTKIIDGAEIARAVNADPRWKVIESGSQDQDDEFVDDDDYGREEYRAPQKRGKKSKAVSKDKKITNAHLRKLLAAKPPAQLLEMLWKYVARDANFKKQLTDEIALASGNFDALLREAQTEMRKLTAQTAWRDSWKGKKSLPDYSGLQKRLSLLLDHGYADAIVELGRELLTRGIQQINESNDNGHTAGEIQECLEIVSAALLQSSLRDEERLGIALEMILQDSFRLCEDLHGILDLTYDSATWSSVADKLSKQLAMLPASKKSDDSWTNSYQRENLSNWVIKLLERAERSDEATQLCIDEATKNGRFVRAVERLIEVKRYDQAETLAYQGLRETAPHWAGTVKNLEDLLIKLAVKKKDWQLPAAIAANRFFENPNVPAYRTLLQATDKAECLAAVTKAAVTFLETGNRPDQAAVEKSPGKSNSAWPLPAPPAKSKPQSRGHFAGSDRGPYFGVLIDLAIDEQRLDDAVKWYDLRKAAAAARKTYPWLAMTINGDERIAKAIEESHPLRAVEIYRELAFFIANATNTKTYPEAAKYLKSIKMLLEQIRRPELWTTIYAEFCTKHGRKPSLMKHIKKIDEPPPVAPRKT